MLVSNVQKCTTVKKDCSSIFALFPITHVDEPVLVLLFQMFKTMQYFEMMLILLLNYLLELMFTFFKNVTT